MATLFAIKAEMAELLENLCDPETGEIFEDVYEGLQQLEMDKDEKIDSWCYYLKQQNAELKADKELLDDAKKRYMAKQNAYDRAKARFEQLMGGEKFKSTYNSVYYRTDKSVALDEGVDIHQIEPDYLKYKDPELDKNKIKAAFGLGITIPGVHMAESTTMIIR